MGKDRRLITKSVTESKNKNQEKIKKAVQKDFEFANRVKLDRKNEFEFAWLRGYLQALENIGRDFF